MALLMHCVCLLVLMNGITIFKKKLFEEQRGFVFYVPVLFIKVITGYAVIIIVIDFFLFSFFLLFFSFVSLFFKRENEIFFCCSLSTILDHMLVTHIAAMALRVTRHQAVY